ncbi:type II toxin-antitoxin system PemK/MazF family toxin [Argonema antarcticum]|uniref:type II toxin-antitoxin system PemK/MazF family toxin n=1 Tax=Argonema antarcticum TaxID=2942763 RepID=UPI002011ECE2|nr:type II toxin-antitoxin system PemK/MazF family toxin [Argonema antarcticum]MCL1475039.1 type II toxin-antitoxin system PemK/MazF family toxin [Argonema antarcticum A004/B2]
MMTIQAGDFWVAEIRFTDGSASKKRPILVLWLDRQDIVAAAVTSTVPRSQTDVALNDWQTSGLRVASTVRLSRLDCLEQSLLLYKLGHISDDDAVRLQEVWVMYVKPQF